MNHPFIVSPDIRPMVPSDLERIVEIDFKVLGKARPDYWEMKIDAVQKHSQFAALVSEVGGRVVGFIIGGAGRWEYGMPENIGWIVTIGVDPEYQRRVCQGHGKQPKNGRHPQEMRALSLNILEQELDRVKKRNRS